jgi:hypothetical protein
LFSSDKESTGGVLYKIVESTEPVPGAVTSQQIKVEHSRYDYNSKSVKTEVVEKTKFGAWDANGNKIMIAAIKGFVRISPLFEFFATRKGKTLIIEYDELYRLQKVDIVTLGVKYVELGNIIKNLAQKNSL